MNHEGLYAESTLNGKQRPKLPEQSEVMIVKAGEAPPASAEEIAGVAAYVPPDGAPAM